MIRGVHHVAISTPSLDRLSEFYQNAIGFELVAQISWPEGTQAINQVLGLKDSSARQAMLKLGNICLELFEFETPTPEPMDPNRPVANHGHTHLCLDVTNIEQVYEDLVKHGVTFHTPPQDFGTVKATYGRDPDGNVFEIQELLTSDDPSKIFNN